MTNAAKTGWATYIINWHTGFANDIRYNIIISLCLYFINIVFTDYSLAKIRHTRHGETRTAQAQKQSRARDDELEPLPISGASPAGGPQIHR